jgi:superfamily I DNA/RNA helicase
MAYGLIARGRGVNFLGRDLGSGLASFVKKLKPKGDSISRLDTKMAAYVERQLAKFAEKEDGESAQALLDKQNCIQVIIQNMEGDLTVTNLLAAIEALFADGTRGVTLSSVHKSKGREWPCVFILDAHLMPSRFAKKPWQRQQEKNLIYVARTRAQVNLRYITSKAWKD